MASIDFNGVQHRAFIYILYVYFIVYIYNWHLFYNWCLFYNCINVRCLFYNHRLFSLFLQADPSMCSSDAKALLRRHKGFHLVASQEGPDAAPRSNRRSRDPQPRLLPLAVVARPCRQEGHRALRTRDTERDGHE